MFLGVSNTPSQGSGASASPKYLGTHTYVQTVSPTETTFGMVTYTGIACLMFLGGQ